MHSNRYTLLFTAIITIVLASLLSLADSSLKEKFERNVDVDIKKNILGSLGFEASDDSPWTNEDVESIFQNSIVGFVVDNSGFVVEDKLPEDIDPSIDLDLFPIYKRVSNNITEGYSIPISGKGLWGTMYGYFSIEADGATAKGITFYSHIETPGLGGEVSKKWFQSNFIGKEIYENNNLNSVKVAKAGYADKNSLYEVDGISGATITSNGVTTFLLRDLKRYEKYFMRNPDE